MHRNFLHRLVVILLISWGSCALAERTLLPENEARELFRKTNGAVVPGTNPNKTIDVTASPAARFDAFVVNPFLAFDLGMTTDPRVVTPEVAAEIVGWTVHPPAAGETGTATERLRRDGRLVYTGFVPVTSFHTGSQNAALTRLQQKGDLDTKLTGGHKDGMLDAYESMQLMVVGEILHRNGIYTTRGLLSAQVKGARRRTEDGAAPAGLELRVADRPRFLDKGNDPYFSLLEKSVPEWSHPLLVSGLEFVDPQRRRQMVTTVNEAQLKDLWALHGSLTHENRSEAVTDLGTFAFLPEPNALVQFPGGITSLWSEVRSAAEMPHTLFHDAFAFHQLRRLGLPDDVILARCFDKRTESQARGDLVYYRAKPETLAFAKNVLALDEITEEASEALRADRAIAIGSKQRSVVNTRRLLRALLTDDVWAREEFPAEAARAALKAAYFDTWARNDPLTGRLSHVAGGHIERVRQLQTFLHGLAPYLKENRAAVVERAGKYAVTQTLPSRTDINEAAIRWFARPETFAKEFVAMVEKADPPTERERRDAYYRARGEAPRFDTLTLFRRLLDAKDCLSLWRKSAPGA